MKFNLLDKIEALEPARLVGRKQVSLAEEYLQDHFPSFPVLPGVFMLEAATQACAWLLHTRSDFARSVAVLKEAKNVKYGHFVAPGNALRVEATYLKPTESGGATFSVAGTVDTGASEPKGAFTARLELAYFDLADRMPAQAGLDERIRQHNRARWALIAPAGAGLSHAVSV